MMQQNTFKKTEIGMIPEKWKFNSVENGAMVYSGFAFKSEDFSDTGIPVIKIGNIQNRVVTINGSVHFPQDKITDKHDKFFLKYKDVLIAMTGQGSVGRVGQLRYKDRAILNQRVGKFVTDEINLNRDYLYYVISSPKYEKILFDRGTGSGQPNLSPQIILSTPIPIPPIDEQRKIAKILSDLDDKIEINRQINQTFKSMTQAIFKSWFVDFEPVKAKIAAIEADEDAEGVTRAAMRAISGKTDDEFDQLQGGQSDDYTHLKNTAELFPAAMQDSELGEMPEGWEVGCVGDVTEKIFSGGTPNTKTESFWNGELNWFSSGETRDMVIVDTEKKITEKGAKNSSTKLAIYGDILIASAGQGHTRGQTSFCAMDTFINQSVVSIRASDIRLSSWLFFNLSGRYEEMRSISDSHSIRGSLTTKLLSSLSTIIPSELLCIEYGKIAEESLIITAENIKQSKVLSKLRDTLLPKLLSGELSVDAIELAEAEA